MLLTLLLSAAVQAPASAARLEPGTPFDGQFSAAADVQVTPALAELLGAEPDAHGLVFEVAVPESGSFHVQARSVAIDVYLILRDSAGVLIAEDDDGWFPPNARLGTLHLETGASYELSVVALGGGEGPLRIELNAGPAPELNAADRDALVRITLVELIDYQAGHFGPESDEVANTCESAGHWFHARAEHQAARTYFERSWKIRARKYGDESEEVIDPVFGVARSAYRAAEFTVAEPLFAEAARLSRQHRGPDHISTADYLGWHADALTALLDYERALEVYAEATAAFEATEAGRAAAGYSIALDSHAGLLDRLGRQAEAIELFAQCLEVRLTAPEPDLNGVAFSRSNLAGALFRSGRSEEARDLYRAALDWFESQPSADSEPLITALTNLAWIEGQVGNLEEERRLAERAMRLAESALSDGDDLATVLNNYAGNLLDADRNAEAAEVLERAYELRQRALGPRHPRAALSASNLGVAYARLERFDEAEQLYQRAVEITRAAFGGAHPDTSEALVVAGIFESSRGQEDRAVPLFLAGIRSAADYLDGAFARMSETDRLEVIRRTDALDPMLAALSAAPNSEMMDALSAYWRWKGQATRYLTAALQLSNTAPSPEVDRLKQRVRELTAALQREAPNGAQAEDSEQEASLRVLQRRRLETERELNRELGIAGALEAPIAADMLAAIPAGSALVDFYVGSEVYAWILKRDSEPVLLEIAPSGELEGMHDSHLASALSRGGASASTKAPEFGRSVWAQVDEHLKGADTVFICPDGFICEVSFDSLTDHAGRYLLERHRFVYLSDAMQLQREANPPNQDLGEALAIGAVDYAQASLGETLQSPGRRSRARAGVAWPALPATQAEIRRLSSACAQSGIPLEVLEGQVASEEAARASMPGKSVLHFATHGYFEPDSFSVEGESLPGLRSGLVLAGANRPSPPERDDGYLSAEEITYLDLSACRLAVLSACETALGSARSGEGLMSLRRAFQVAGADAVISSLWKVDDEATAELMSDFYTNYLKLGMSKIDALHAAKLASLRRNIERYGEARPATWGAFVLSGDWR